LQSSLPARCWLDVRKVELDLPDGAGGLVPPASCLTGGFASFDPIIEPAERFAKGSIPA